MLKVVPVEKDRKNRIYCVVKQASVKRWFMEFTLSLILD